MNTPTTIRGDTQKPVYDTNKYDTQYHDDATTITKNANDNNTGLVWVVKDGQLTSLPQTDPAAKGEMLYYQPGSYKYGPGSYVPGYEDSVFMSKLTRVSYAKPITDTASMLGGICAQYKNSPEQLEEACNRLDKNVCAATTCCVLIGGEKCVSGGEGGPTMKVNYNDPTIRNRDLYYHQGKCYGNCSNTFDYASMVSNSDIGVNSYDAAYGGTDISMNTVLSDTSPTGYRVNNDDSTKQYEYVHPGSTFAKNAAPATAPQTNEMPAAPIKLNIDLSLFFPPIVNQGNLLDCQTYSMVYYIGTYFYTLTNLGLMDDTGKISINNVNYMTLYNNNSTQLQSYYANPSHILNPLYNFIALNNSCGTKNLIAGTGICSVILEYYQILNSIGSCSSTVFTLPYNKTSNSVLTDASSNIAGCSLANVKAIAQKAKIQPFVKQRYTIIYLYKNSPSVQMASITCNSNPPLPTNTTLTPMYYSNAMDSNSILPVIKQYLNRGVPLRYAIVYSSSITTPKSFKGYFSSSITNSQTFPNVSDNAIITEASYTEGVNDGHIVTIVGYSDFTVSDGSTGVFKFANSWGTNYGVNGYGYISYNAFTMPVSKGGISRQLIAFE